METFAENKPQKDLCKIFKQKPVKTPTVTKIGNIKRLCPIISITQPKKLLNNKQQKIGLSIFKKNRNSGILVTRLMLPVEKMISAGM